MAWIDSASADISVAKTNLFPIGGADPTKYIQATQDWNKLRTGALDIRDWIRGDVLNWYGFGNQAGDPAPASIASYIYATATDIKFKQGATLKNVFDDRGLGILEFISYTGGTLAPASKMWFRNNAGTPEYSYNGGAWTAFSGAIYSASLGVSLVGNDFRLNQAYSPTWTASHLFNAAAVGITENVDVAIKTTTAAALGAQQWSPGFSLSGNGWATGTSASMPVEYLHQLETYQGATVPSGGLAIKSRHNGGAWTKFYELFDSVNADQSMIRVTGRAKPVLQARQNATTTGNADVESFNDLTGFIRIRSFGSAANNASNLGGSAAAAANSNNLSASGRLDIFTTGADDVIIGTGGAPRTTWTGATGDITHSSNFTLSTTKTLSAGANTLVSGDKLQATQIAIAAQARGGMLKFNAGATALEQLLVGAAGTVLVGGTDPAYTATPTLTSLGLASGSAGAPALYHATGGDTNTGLYFPAADQVALVTGGSARILADSSTILMGLILTGLAGSAALPSYGFTGDPNSGLYSVGADQVGISAGGTLRFTVSTTALTSTLPVLAPAGTAGAPSLSFSGDADSGLYSSAADEMGAAIGGTQRFKFDANRFSGKFGSGSFPASYDGVSVGSSSSCAFHAISSSTTLFAGLNLENDSGSTLVALIWGSSAAGDGMTGVALANAAQIRTGQALQIHTTGSTNMTLGTHNLAQMTFIADAGVTMNTILCTGMFTSLAAANNLAPDLVGNSGFVTGNTQINLIANTGRPAGTILTLVFTGTPTIKHGTATSGANQMIRLSGSVDLVAANHTVLTLLNDGTQWQEIGRKAP